MPLSPYRLQSTFSRQVTTVSSRWSLVVSGIPAYAGTDASEDTPGTTSKQRPALAQASASSGPEA